MDYDGKVVMVTGAGAGQGRASAIAFAKLGAAVAVIDRDAAGAEETSALIEKEGGHAHTFAADVCQEDQVREAVEQVLAALGRLDAAHNNAGLYQTPALVAQTTLEEWQRLLTGNLTATFLCMKYELSVMADAGSGAIVNTSSRAGLHGLPASAAYSAAMHGVVGLTQTAAIEYGPRGVRVNALCAGGIDTPALRGALTAEQLAGVASAYPLGRLGTPDEFANAAVWLCSDAASFVTGAAFLLDGGHEAR